MPDTTQDEALKCLLEWRDPISNELLNLLINREASVDEQIRRVKKLSHLNFRTQIWRKIDDKS